MPPENVCPDSEELWVAFGWVPCLGVPSWVGGWNGFRCNLGWRPLHRWVNRINQLVHQLVHLLVHQLVQPAASSTHSSLETDTILFKHPENRSWSNVDIMPCYFSESHNPLESVLSGQMIFQVKPQKQFWVENRGLPPIFVWWRCP